MALAVTLDFTFLWILIMGMIMHHDIHDLNPCIFKTATLAVKNNKWLREKKILALILNFDEAATAMYVKS
jgi:hypothetical protein